jgi:hypothetical protein
MAESRRSLPWERASVLSKIAFTVEAFVEGVEHASIEDFIETFE